MLKHAALRHFSTVELVRKLGDVIRAATREPVAITQHRKPRYVLMSYEAFTELTGAADVRRAYGIGETPQDVRQILEEGLDRLIQESDRDV
jgi:prevent-host-death family protein